jgi:O-antigen ligase
VGSGDLNSAYEDAYLKIDSNMVQTKRLRAHNQYLTFFVMFGVLGFVLSMISLFLPAFKSFNRGGFLYFCFLIMMFISMLNEDTLETQAGVTFFIVFYTIFAFLNRDQNIEELN